MSSVVKTAGAALLGLALITTSACGFRPLYGDTGIGTTTAEELSSIRLNTRNARADYLVRTNLIDKLQLDNAPGEPRYELVLRLRDEEEGVAIEADTSITRFNYRLLADFDLMDVTTGKKIFTGVSRSVAAYNVVDDQFATLSAQRNAEERAALDITDDIKLQLAIFLDRYVRGD